MATTIDSSHLPDNITFTVTITVNTTRKLTNYDYYDSNRDHDKHQTSITNIFDNQISLAMDHLCPRLSFPLAPCLQCCLSGSLPSTEPKPQTGRRSNSIQSVVFPMPPKSVRPAKSTQWTKNADKRSRRPKLSLQTRLSSIPQKQVMDELSLSLAAFCWQQKESTQPQPQAPAVRSMRKDSATAPWLEPISQVQANT